MAMQKSYLKNLIKYLQNKKFSSVVSMQHCPHTAKPLVQFLVVYYYFFLIYFLYITISFVILKKKKSQTKNNLKNFNA